MQGKILCIQISDRLINKNVNQDSLMGDYYKLLYDVKEIDGYFKPFHFWELPQWVAEINNNIKTDLHICTDVNETVDFLLNHNYKYICFSVLTVNRNIVNKIIDLYYKRHWNKKTLGSFVCSGYIDINKEHINYDYWFNTIKDFIQFLGLQYKQGVNYNIFKGYKTIPRLTLSTGCLYNCDFCTIEKQIKKIPTHIIEQQIKSFKPLHFRLVYINDKTFGQCSNYKLLPRIYKAIKEYNKHFEGFIIQTTTADVLKLSDVFIKDAHIKYIELGIETFNDSILKKYHKPSNEALTVKSCDKIRGLKDVKLIPNIIIGIPEETTETYTKTLQFLFDNSDIISHLNIYCLAVYDNTNLAKRIKHDKNNDSNEMSLNKSFYDSNVHHISFYQSVFTFGIDILRGIYDKQ